MGTLDKALTGKYTELETSVNGLISTVGTIENPEEKGTLSAQLSTLQHTANSIQASVTAIEEDYATKGELSLSIKEEEGKLVSQLKKEVDEIRFKSDKLSIDSTNFTLTKEGEITATAGQIGGYTISSTTLTSGNVGMSSDSAAGAIAFWAGNLIGAEAPFRVTNDGKLVATSAKITGHIEATMSSDDKTPNTINNLAADKGNIAQLSSDRVDVNGLIIQSSAITDYRGGKIDFGINYGAQVRIVAEIIPRYSHDFVGGGTYITIELTDELDTDTDFVIVCNERIGGRDLSRTCVVTVPAGSLRSEEERISTITPDYSGSQGVTATFAVSGSTTYAFYAKKNSASNNPLIRFTGDLMPNGARKIGSENNMWESVWVVDAECNLSDRNYKNNIMPLERRYDKVFDTLRPVSYKMNNGNSGRKHIGLIAQELKDSIVSAGLTTKDFGAYVEWKNKDGATSCGIRYTELIALNIYEIQELKRRVMQLEAMLQRAIWS